MPPWGSSDGPPAARCRQCGNWPVFFGLAGSETVLIQSLSPSTKHRGRVVGEILCQHQWVECLKPFIAACIRLRISRLTEFHQLANMPHFPNSSRASACYPHPDRGRKVFPETTTPTNPKGLYLRICGQAKAPIHHLFSAPSSSSFIFRLPYRMSSDLFSLWSILSRHHPFVFNACPFNYIISFELPQLRNMLINF